MSRMIDTVIILFLGFIVFFVYVADSWNSLISNKVRQTPIVSQEYKIKTTEALLTVVHPPIHLMEYSVNDSCWNIFHLEKRKKLNEQDLKYYFEQQIAGLINDSSVSNNLVSYNFLKKDAKDKLDDFRIDSNFNISFLIPKDTLSEIVNHIGENIILSFDTTEIKLTQPNFVGALKVIFNTNQALIIQNKEQVNSNFKRKKRNKKYKNNKRKAEIIYNYEDEPKPHLTKKDNLEKKLNYLKKHRDFYFNIHKYRIEQRFFRALTYTNTRKNDFKIKFQREGQYQQHLNIKINIPLDRNTSFSPKNHPLSEISGCIIQALKEYFSITNTEDKADELLKTLLSKILININSNDVNLNSENPSLLITQKVFSNFKNSTNLLTRRSKINLESVPVAEQPYFSIEVVLYNLFSEAYKAHQANLPQIEEQIKILQDSLEALN